MFAGYEWSRACHIEGCQAVNLRLAWWQDLNHFCEHRTFFNSLAKEIKTPIRFWKTFEIVRPLKFQISVWQNILQIFLMHHWTPLYWTQNLIITSSSPTFKIHILLNISYSIHVLVGWICLTESTTILPLLIILLILICCRFDYVLISWGEVRCWLLLRKIEQQNKCK